MSAPPARFGPYRPLRTLGRGGMGTVVEAEGPGGERVAVKTLAPGADPTTVVRLRLEAEALARLDHPHIVRARGADLGATPPWLAVELLPGGSLEDRLRARGPLPPAEAAALGAALAGALAHAHARGVLHRDLKPANILFDAAGAPKVVDFGLARGTVRSRERLTITGEVLGTPAYMAPEQALGTGDVDARTDVHGLGAVLHAALTGHAPFGGKGAIAVLQAVVEEPPAPLPASVPRPLAEVVARCLAKRPEDRYPTAAEVAAALARLAAAPATGCAWRALVAFALASALAVAVAAVALLVLVARAAPATPPPAPPAPPPLRLDLEPCPPEAFGPTLLLRGQVDARAAGPVRVVAGEARADVAPGATFTLTVPLRGAPGRVALEVQARDAAGRVATATARTDAHPDLPAWVGALPPADRPRSLPAGVRPADEPGTARHEATGVTLCWVPPGGRPGRPPGAGLWCGRTELTWAELERLLGRPPDVAPHVFPRPALPVHSLSPGDLAEVHRLLARAGLRLPTADEWAWAALGRLATPFPWGDAPPDPTRADVGHGDGPTHVAPVGSHPADRSPFGLLDVVGGVRELVARDPGGPAAGTRGGSWLSRPGDRYALEGDPEGLPDTYHHGVGLRVAVDP